MSSNEPELMDAPNQQVVRADGSGPGDVQEGATEPQAEGNPLDEMTKSELVEYAEEHEIAVDPATTKSEIRAAIDAAEGN